MLQLNSDALPREKWDIFLFRGLATIHGIDVFSEDPKSWAKSSINDSLDFTNKAAGSWLDILVLAIVIVNLLSKIERRVIIGDCSMLAERSTLQHRCLEGTLTLGRNNSEVWNAFAFGLLCLQSYIFEYLLPFIVYFFELIDLIWIWLENMNRSLDLPFVQDDQPLAVLRDGYQGLVTLVPVPGACILDAWNLGVLEPKYDVIDKKWILGALVQRTARRLVFWDLVFDEWVI